MIGRVNGVKLEEWTRRGACAILHFHDNCSACGCLGWVQH